MSRNTRGYAVCDERGTKGKRGSPSMVGLSPLNSHWSFLRTSNSEKPMPRGLNSLRKNSESRVKRKEGIPQGLKPAFLFSICGTTKVVPFQNETFMTSCQDGRFVGRMFGYKTRRGLCGQGLDENAGDVVLASALLGYVDEVSACGHKGRSGEDGGDFILENIAGEAIGGQQDGGAGFEIDGEEVGLHVGRDSNRAGNHRLHAFQIGVA